MVDARAEPPPRALAPDDVWGDGSFVRARPPANGPERAPAVAAPDDRPLTRPSPPDRTHHCCAALPPLATGAPPHHSLDDRGDHTHL
eukprot:6224472-Prymnesium_polylepis.1